MYRFKKCNFDVVPFFLSYGREEMLALFDAAMDPDDNEDMDPPEGPLRKPGQFASLWMRKAQLPLNLQGHPSEEEQRAWQRGANSEASIR